MNEQGRKKKGRWKEHESESVHDAITNGQESEAIMIHTLSGVCMRANPLYTSPKFPFPILSCLVKIFSGSERALDPVLSLNCGDKQSCWVNSVIIDDIQYVHRATMNAVCHTLQQNTHIDIQGSYISSRVWPVLYNGSHKLTTLAAICASNRRSPSGFS